MKKLILVGVACMLATMSFAAAPAPHNYTSVKASDTVTNSNVFTGTWKNITSIIPVASDSANVILTFGGFVIGNPGSTVYLGFSADSAGATAAPTLDTVKIVFPRIVGQPGQVRVPFTWQRGKSNNGALTDTIYVKAAVGGSSQSDVVYFEDVCLSGSVNDQ